MGAHPSHILHDNLIQGGMDVLVFPYQNPILTIATVFDYFCFRVKNKDWFERNGITHVVSVCDCTPAEELIPSENKIHIDVDDCPSVDLYPHFVRTTQFIHKARSGGGKVFVHCAAGRVVLHRSEYLLCSGISRSSTITLAYLMTWLDVSFQDALSDLRLARQGVCVN